MIFGLINSKTDDYVQTVIIIQYKKNSLENKMAAIPANFDFQIRSIAENVLRDLYYFYANV